MDFYRTARRYIPIQRIYAVVYFCQQQSIKWKTPNLVARVRLVMGTPPLSEQPSHLPFQWIPPAFNSSNSFWDWSNILSSDYRCWDLASYLSNAGKFREAPSFLSRDYQFGDKPISFPLTIEVGIATGYGLDGRGSIPDRECMPSWLGPCWDTDHVWSQMNSVHIPILFF
jgi:hypothetical protein